MIAMTAPHSRGKSAVKYITLRISTVDAPYKRATDAVTISVQTPPTTTAFAQRPLCSPAELWYCRTPYSACNYGDLTATQLRSYPNDGVFVHAQSARRRSAFYATPMRLVAMSLRCCGDACDRTACTSAFCIFLGRRGIAVRTRPWCDRGFKNTVRQTACMIVNPIMVAKV